MPILNERYITPIEFSCLVFSFSTFALRCSTLARFFVTRSLGSEDFDMEREPCLHSIDWSWTTWSSFSAASNFFFCLCSSVCWTTMAWISSNKLLIPLDATLSGVWSRARFHCSHRVYIFDSSADLFRGFLLKWWRLSLSQAVRDWI